MHLSTLLSIVFMCSFVFDLQFHFDTFIFIYYIKVRFKTYFIEELMMMSETSV